MFHFFKKKNKDPESTEEQNEQAMQETADGSGGQAFGEDADIPKDGQASGEDGEVRSDSLQEGTDEDSFQKPEEAGEENTLEAGDIADTLEAVDDEHEENENAAADPDGTGEMKESGDIPQKTAKKPKKGLFGRLVAGLTKTRASISQSFDQLFKGFKTIDDDFYEELEETLIMADLGLDTTERIIEELKGLVKKNHIKEAEACRELVIQLIREQMFVEDSAYDFENQQTVMLIIGVNGVGKTTSIGKLAAQYKGRGKQVMMCAADTFRAAAIDQLKTWAQRADVPIIAQNEGSDPAAVTFDAVKAAAARNIDILLVDTAGRLHNKKNLMDELAKMRRIIEKEYSSAHLETLIVLDGSTGQNALEQARQFSTVTHIDGIILTKLDGTAKGGIAIAIQSELNVPVKYIGVGEQINDLQKFDPDAYVAALFADMDTREDIEILIPHQEEK